MLENAKWISGEPSIPCPVFTRHFELTKKPLKAKLEITSLGVYSALLNHNPVGDFLLAPGWTVYRERVQVQEYDVTDLLLKKNRLSVTVSGGWYCSSIGRAPDKFPVLIASLTVTYQDGTVQTIVTDKSWWVEEGKTRFADIYHGEIFDATFVPSKEAKQALLQDIPHSILIAQQGEKIVAVEKLRPFRHFLTPKGEQLLDFGQEFTGTISLKVTAPYGTKIRITCCEMLDAQGNFYSENYRSAKSEMIYICAGGKESWQPSLSFFGFRYLRVEGTDLANCEIEGIVLCSDIKQTGSLTSGVQKLNRLFSNIIWGQKSNFLDVPTDCPQRDERLGWTGDAQVFCNTACWQYDVKKFFTKWLADVKIEQLESGAIPCVVPNVSYFPGITKTKASTAWGETATVCPWQLYRHYGDKELLASQFDLMKGWVDFITSDTDQDNLWVGYEIREGHFGDWLGLDAEEGSYVGSSDKDLIASAFYYYSTGLVVNAGHILGRDVSAYEELHSAIYSAYQTHFTQFKTQTECVLTLYFGLAGDRREAIIDILCELIYKNGGCLTTGFVGTPYLLYALSENGKLDLAYSLLLQEKFPSWLYSVNQGATTIWEHWDGKKEDGSFWSKDMNSFNHYAYGAVAAWVYEVAAGITPAEPGFATVNIAPNPDPRLGWLKAEHQTTFGTISSAWYCEENRVRYEITTPVKANVLIDGNLFSLEPGSYIF